MTEEIETRLAMIQAGKVPEGYVSVSSGVIPQEWSDKRMSDVIVQIKETAGNKQYETLSISAGIGFVNQAKKFGREMAGAQYSKYIVLHRGDFSYNKGNSNKYPQGCIYRLNDREEAAVPNVFESFRFLSLNSDYYEQLFISGYLNKQLDSKINHGVRDDGLLNLTANDFYSCHLPIPPLPEQQKIAEILTQCDKVMALKQRKIDELKQLKKACLDKMFPKDGSNVPEIRFPGFSDAWEQRKLGEMSTFITKGATPTTYGFAWVESGIPFFRNDSIKDNRFVYGEYSYISADAHAAIERSEIHGDDILIAITGDIGKVGIVPQDIEKANINQHMARVRVVKNALPYFVYQYLSTEEKQTEYQKIKTGISMPQLSLEQIRDTSIISPTIVEQTKIADFFYTLDHLITLHQRELEERQKYKKALMQLLLTGIVRVKV